MPAQCLKAVGLSRCYTENEALRLLLGPVTGDIVWFMFSAHEQQFSFYWFESLLVLKKSRRGQEPTWKRRTGHDSNTQNIYFAVF